MFATRRLLLPHVYRAKRPWPPDFSQLPTDEQFRFERKYKRRLQLKYARPKLHKVVQLLQWGLCSSVVVYCIWFADWPQHEHIFGPIRGWTKEKLSLFWSTPAPPRKDDSGDPEVAENSAR